MQCSEGGAGRILCVVSRLREWGKQNLTGEGEEEVREMTQKSEMKAI